MSTYTPRHCAESRLRAALMRFLKRIDGTHDGSTIRAVWRVSGAGCGPAAVLLLFHRMKGDKSMTTREQIEWYLDRITDEKLLKQILAAVGRLFVGYGRRITK